MRMARIYMYVMMLPLLISCDMSPKPYLKHEVSLTPATGSCSEKSGLRIETNIIGERYLFQDCLLPGFRPADVTVQRHGDTVVIQYGRQSGAGQLVDFIVSVQTHPRYHFVNIAVITYPVITAAY